MAESNLPRLLADGAEIMAASFPGLSSAGVLLGKLRAAEALTILEERVEELALTIQQHVSPSRLNDLVDDPIFVAAYAKAAQAVQLSESDERIEWLRNGLLNGYVDGKSPDDREWFMEVVRRYSPRHMRVLETYSGVPAKLGRPVTFAIEQRVQMGDREANREESARQVLVADGLLRESSELGPRRSDGIGGFEDQKILAQYRITELGDAFLTFIQDPGPTSVRDPEE